MATTGICMVCGGSFEQALMKVDLEGSSCASCVASNPASARASGLAKAAIGFVVAGACLGYEVAERTSSTGSSRTEAWQFLIFSASSTNSATVQLNGVEESSVVVRTIDYVGAPLAVIAIALGVATLVRSGRSDAPTRNRAIGAFVALYAAYQLAGSVGLL